MTSTLELAAIDLRDFLENVPPGTQRQIIKFGDERIRTYLSSGFTDTTGVKLSTPEIHLYCEDPACGGVRVFFCEEDISLHRETVEDHFLHYVCKNCTKYEKTYALRLRLDQDCEKGVAFKLGEKSQFGPPLPSRLISLIRPERELLNKGRRCENQGLGVAAFAYYRRVIEGQKNRIFDEILRIIPKLSASPDLVAEITAAKSETQFDKAVAVIKHAMPDSLLVNGQNPLLLLHDALSEGLHAQTDDECLQIATDIRVVMAEFAERMSQAVKDDEELSSAVNRMLQRRAERSRSSAAAS